MHITHSIELEIRALKREIRSTPTPRIAQRALIQKKAEATILYATIAHGRGRLHLRKLVRRHAALGLPPLPVFTLEDQARLVAAHAPRKEVA